MREAAGYILFHGHGDDRRFLLLKNARHGTWAFPKGHLEKDEDCRTGARRELLEETGISELRDVEGFMATIEYRVPAGHHPDRPDAYKKRVSLFLGEVTSDAWTKSAEHEDGGWMSADDALATMTHDQTADALRAALEFLSIVDVT